MTDVFITGIGMTHFGKSLDLGIRSYAEEAASEALADSGLKSTDIDRVYFSNAIAGLITGQEMIRGQVALRHLGLDGVPIINVENACASGSTALALGTQDIRSGLAWNVLVVGAERMSHQDKKKGFDAIGTAIDLDEFADLESDYGLSESRSGSLFMEIYAHEAREYMAESGATPADIAAVAAKSRAHGALNPRAQYREETSAETVLASRMISDPLTLLMCSPIGDGAAAVVLSARPSTRSDSAPSIRVLANALATAKEDGLPVVTRAARSAYEDAGVGPADLDLVELHDAAASAELVLTEQLELCEAGGAVSLLRSGETRLGGRIPINTSGGLISRGHPIGATGVAQVVELTEQLRGHAGPRQVSGARIGLSQNSGGHMWSGPAVACVTIIASSLASND
jgi:acetyl-CoA acetyltransferase